MLRPGISSFAFGWAARTPSPPEARRLDEVALLEFALQHGLSVVQFGDNLPLHELGAERIERLACRARENGIALETGARRMTGANLQAYIEISRRLEARLLRFVLDGVDYAPAPEEVVAVAREALPDLRAAGVVLGLENHDRFSCNALRGIIDAIGSEQVGVCLDTANSLWAGEGIREVLTTLGPVCVNLHVKDFAIERFPYKMGFTVSGRALGQGMLPLDATLTAADQSGRCGSAIIELWTPPESTIDATIEKEARWAADSVVVLCSALARLATGTETSAAAPLRF